MNDIPNSDPPASGSESSLSRSQSLRSGPPPYDAVLLVSFGGPERLQDVVPFLENVVRGKQVPGDRLAEIAEHYKLFDGVSPINAQNRALLAALLNELAAHGPALPVYWGNLNWHPMLVDTLRQMADDGLRRALAFVTSAFSSYPGCRQYLEAIEHARRAIGSEAPQVDKIRVFYNHPGFIEPMAERVDAALAEVPGSRRSAARIIYTAHSIPVAMAKKSPYEEQLREACRLVSERLGRADWELAYQSRSGPADQPWLEPDVGDYLRNMKQKHRQELCDVVLVPIGFVCEHMEIVYDLDVVLAELCAELEINLVRCATVGCHPRFVQMIRQLVQERMDPTTPRLALGNRGAGHDFCPPNCCPQA